MKKYIAIVFVLVFCLSLCACGLKSNDFGNLGGGGGQVVVPTDVSPTVNTPDQETVGIQDSTQKYRELQIVLNTSYLPQSNGQFISEDEKTTIYLEPHSLDKFCADYNVGMSEDLINFVIAYKTVYEPDLGICGLTKDCFYIYKEVDNEDGSGLCTIMSAFFRSNEHFWELRFVSDGRSWDDVSPQWYDYLYTVTFNYE